LIEEELNLLCRDREKLDAGTETKASEFHELYYHFLGTDQSQDILCWKDTDNPKHRFEASVTEDGKVSFITVLKVSIFKYINPLYFWSLS